MIAALALAAVLLPATDAPSAPVDPSATAEVYWALPDGGTADRVTWPQTYTPDPSKLACGVTYQVDRYLVSDIPRLTADGKLDLGEDYNGIAISWHFVTAPACEVVVPPTAPPAPPVEEPTAPPVIEQPAPLAEPAAPVAVTPAAQLEAVPAPAEPTLAMTGPGDYTPALAAFALLILASGGWLVRKGYRRS